ncbi:MAG: TraB/GumN family protein [Alistipes sp.]|nr:TraB/GumN family protein [Alistipes sp.]
MRKFFGTLFLALAFYGSANAQLLYKISGNGLKSPSYIVGTYHLAPASFADEIAGMSDAFAIVEQVYGEVDMLNLQASQIAMAQAMMLPEGKYVSDMFSAEEMDRINAYMRASMGMDLNHPMLREQLGRMRPSVLAMQLGVLEFIKITPNFNPNDLIDSYFQKEASKRGLPVGGFETTEFQIELLYGESTDEEERKALLKLVDDKETMLAEMQAMTNAYFSFDMKGIYELTIRSIETGEMTPEEFAEMITDRNRNWVAVMPEIMSVKPTLFVVGAGHLPGEDGVVELLKARGYKVKPVK